METRTERNSKRRQKFAVEKRNYSRLYRFNWVLWVILLLLVSVTIGSVIYFSALQFNQLNTIIYVLGAICVIVSFILLISKKNKWFVFVWNSLGILLFGALVYKGYTVFNMYRQLEQSQTPMVKTLSVLVPKNSSIATIQQIGVEAIAAPTQSDSANVDTLAKDIETNMKLKVFLQNTASYLSAYQELVGLKVRGIAMNSAYASLLEKIAPEYSSSVKSIYNVDVKTESKIQADHSAKSFNVLVSAVDTTLPINSLGRSDVSLIVSANTTTNKVLLTQTPVTTLVTLDNTNYDQLGNDFMYGIDKALEMSSKLYQTTVQYYVRIHLEKLTALIDRLGGIEVDNTTEFTTSYGGHRFPVGKVYLDKHKALGYMRENVVVDGVSLKEKHQLDVLGAVFKKLVSLDVVINTQEYVTQLQNALQTNLPLNRLMTLTNVLMNQKDIPIQTLKVTLKNDVPSTVLPGVMLTSGEVQQDSLTSAQTAIKSVLGE